MTEQEFENLPLEKQMEMLYESAKRDFEDALKESGKSKAVWMATDKQASQMLGEWLNLQVMIKKEYGYELPNLTDGVSVKFREDSDD